MARSFFFQVKALIIKNMNIIRRNRCSLLFELLLPYLILIGAIKVANQVEVAMPYVESFNTSFKEPTTKGTIKLKAGVPNFYYSPSSSSVDKIIKFIETNAKHSEVVSCADEPEVLRKMEGNDSFDQGVIFNSLEPNLRFTIRSKNTLIASFFGIFEKSLERHTNPFIQGLEYLWSGFIGLHWAITSAEVVPRSARVTKWLKYEPSYNVLTEDVKTRLSRWLLTSNMEMKIVVVAIIFGNLIAFGSAAERAATEKRNGSRELLRIMGVSDCTYWVSQFVTYLPLLIVQSILMSIVIFIGLNQKPLERTPFFGFFLMLFSLFFSQLLIFFTIATFFYVPLIAEIANFGMICAEALIVYFSPKYPFSTGSEVLRAFFFPPVLFFTWWKNVSSEPNSLKPRMIAILLIPFWDFFAIILFYVDAVCPWQKGYTKPWNFFLKYKKSGRIKDMKGINVKYDSILVEDIPGEPIIVCCDLYKTYSLFGTKKLAVENLSLKVLRNQITVLLGHNGAGKTTLLSMISGFTGTSYGHIYVNGYDVERDSIAARQTIALCPQEDCLYEDLTVKENISLCANLRGVDIEIVSSIMELLNLEEKSSAFASKLSGGMRRRLQLGMALATDCDTIILDEPTSGLDPEMRRTVWNHLKSLRCNKTIFISTQSMEEADALADQIVIMSSGHIRCIGSPMFLKTKLAAGYSLTIEKDEFKADATFKLVKKYYPKAVSICETDDEACYSLNAEESDPKKSDNLSTLADLCDELDKAKEKLGISSYTIDTATIEDIFMRVTVDEGIVTEDRLTFSLVKDKTMADLIEVLNYSIRHKNLKHFSQGMRGLMTKRYHYASRDYQSILIKYVFPLIIVLIGVSVVRIDTTYYANIVSFPSREISPDLYYSNFPDLKVLFSGEDNSTLKPCFLRINYQYKLEVIETSLRIAEYINQTGISRVAFDAQFLFALQDVGLPQNITIYVSQYYFYSLPIAISNYLNVLRCLATDEDKLYHVVDHDLPEPPTFTSFTLQTFIHRSLFNLLLLILLSLLFPAFYFFPAMESSTKARLIQKMAGLGNFSYWISNLIFDMSNFCSVAGLLIVLIILRGFRYLASMEILLTFLALFTVCGFAGISFTYFFSHIKDNSRKAYIYLSTDFFLFGFVTCSLFTFLTNFESFKKYEKFIPDFLKAFPSVGMGMGMEKILQAAIISYACGTMKENFRKDDNQFAFSMENIKKYCLDGEKPSYFILVLPEIYYMLLFGSFFFVIVIVISVYEHKFSKFFDYMASILAPAVKKPKKIGDKDVRNEEKTVDMAIETGEYEYEGMVAHKITKDYFTCKLKRFRAVYDVSFTVHKKECFGLLGVNGAGKTTVFSMLTGEKSMSSGQAYVDILHVYYDIARYRTDVSYCPQELALLDLLTPIETLTLFARLRAKNIYIERLSPGIAEVNVSKNVDFIITMTDMEKCCRSLNCNLSSGNKRKLSLAIAVVGGPAVIMLDEPTSGVDPASRRKIWATLISLRDATKISILLTSHSMRECETLCNRIAIMAKGQIACLGSPSHLKKKYGKGYTLTIQLKEENDVSVLKESIKEAFKEARLKDQHERTVTYVLANPKLRWGQMYRSVKKLEDKCSIETFSIDDTSIEQVFLHFSNEEEE